MQIDEITIELQILGGSPDRGQRRDWICRFRGTPERPRMMATQRLQAVGLALMKSQN